MDNISGRSEKQSSGQNEQVYLESWISKGEKAKEKGFPTVSADV